MITWIQDVFLKHNKIIFGGLLAVVIVTFVLYVGPSSFFSDPGASRQQKLEFFGYNLASEAVRGTLQFDAELSASLMPELGIRGESLRDYAFMRAAALGMANRLGLPEASQPELEAYIKGKMVFQNPQTRAFDPASYNRLTESIKTSGRYSEEMLARILREDARIARVRALLGGPVYMLPFEALQQKLAEETEVGLDLARLSYTNFKPELNPTPEQLRAAYDADPAKYAVPEKLRASGIVFRAARFRDQVPAPAAAEVESFFNANPWRYQKPAPQPEAGKEPAPAPETKFEEVQEQVANDLVLDRARELAATASDTFVTRVYTERIARNTPAFIALMDELQAERVTLEPFAREQIPFRMDVPRQALESLFGLIGDSERYFSDLAPTQDGATVAIIEEVIPGSQPAFEAVATAVESDWKEQERKRLFTAKGAELQEQLKATLGLGKSFTDAAQSAGLKVESPAVFKGNNLPEGVGRDAAWFAARNLPVGAVSAMIQEGEQGSFVHVRERREPTLSAEAPEVQALLQEQTKAGEDMVGWVRLHFLTKASLVQVAPELSQR